MTRRLFAALAMTMMTAMVTEIAFAQDTTSATPSATVRVRVVHDAAPVRGAIVRSGRVADQTADAGIATLR
jgi:hypothetical protein